MKHKVQRGNKEETEENEVEGDGTGKIDARDRYIKEQTINQKYGER